ncbi:MMPL family transporter [Streptomyces spongiae]|uniref:hypothetical protein n=1 Tax=Streptomyces spongiae TaxID=565072 RepID=UPI001D1575BF|nr:hypothetical protein [Streptomyces spongiae]
MVIALTLLPAMLGFAGVRIMKGKLLTRRMKALERGEGESMGVRWARFVTRNPVKMLAVSVVGLALVAIPTMSLKMALNDDSGKPSGSTQRVAYDTLSKGFGPGFNGPLTVVVDARDSDNPKAAAQDAHTMLSKLDDVAAVRPPSFNQAGDVALIGAVPKSAATSKATKDLVGEIRGHSGALHQDTGADLMVTGLTAINIDVSTKLSDALVPYLAIVVGLALVLLPGSGAGSWASSDSGRRFLRHNSAPPIAIRATRAKAGVDVHVISQTGSVVPARSCDLGEGEGGGPPGSEVSGPSRAVKDACGVATAMSCAHP